MSDCFLFCQFYLQNKYLVVLWYSASSEKNVCRCVKYFFFLAESSSSSKLRPRSSLPCRQLLRHSFPIVHLCWRKLHTIETSHLELLHYHTSSQECSVGAGWKVVAAKNWNVTDTVSLILGGRPSTVSLQIMRNRLKNFLSRYYTWAMLFFYLSLICTLWMHLYTIFFKKTYFFLFFFSNCKIFQSQFP